MTDVATTPISTALPEGAPRGGVIVIQEAFGITSYIQDLLTRFAALGYAAAAPHLFHRTGDPALSYDNFDEVRPQMMALTATGIDTDVDAALSSLTALGLEPGHCAIVGFCMGGSVTIHTAVRLKLGAAVSFYGGGIAEGRFGYPSQLEVAGTLQTPWLGLFGDLDEGIPTDQVEELRVAAATSAVPTEIVRYPHAKHGFHCDARPAAYDADSATDAWRRCVEWFEGHLTLNAL